MVCLGNDNDIHRTRISNKCIYWICIHMLTYLTTFHTDLVDRTNCQSKSVYQQIIGLLNLFVEVDLLWALVFRIVWCNDICFKLWTCIFCTQSILIWKKQNLFDVWIFPISGYLMCPNWIENLAIDLYMCINSLISFAAVVLIIQTFYFFLLFLFSMRFFTLQLRSTWITTL